MKSKNYSRSSTDQNFCEEEGERFLPAGSIDLHIHTTASDGMVSSNCIVQKAKENNLVAIAITDHDTIMGVAIAKEEGLLQGIEVISGAEFSAKYKPVMHILGLYIDVENETLCHELHRLARSRMRLIAKSFKAVNRYGISIAPQEIQEKGKAITIVNLREYLLNNNMMKPHSCLDTQILKILDEWRNCLPSPLECISLIHSCGGAAILAHPILLHQTDRVLLQLIKQLKKDGLDGIEVIHPAHSAHDQVKLSKWAEDLNLLCSGGSDYHGERDHYAKKNNMQYSCERFVPYSYLERIQLKVKGNELC